MNQDLNSRLFQIRQSIRGMQAILADQPDSTLVLRQHLEVLETLVATQRPFLPAAEADPRIQVDRLAVINEVGRTITRQLEQGQLFRTICEQLKQVMLIDAFLVWRYEREINTLVALLVYDEGVFYDQPPVPLPPATSVGHTLETGESILICRTPEEIETLRLDRERAMGNTAKLSASLIYVPLPLGDQIMGVMSAQSYRLNAFNQEDVALLAGIANHVAVALENARLFQQVQSYAAQLETRIATRTADLTAANEQLRREILDRRLAEYELQQYRSHLEELVQARTEELLHTNNRLQQEVAERKQIEVAREELLWAEHRQHLLAETLREVTLALTSHMDHNAVLAEVLRQVQRIVPYQTANIALLEKTTLRVVGWQGYDKFGAEAFIANMNQPLAECITERRSLARGEPFLVADSRQEPDWIVYEETAWIRSCLIMPIQLRERKLGVLRLDDEQPNRFSQRDVEQLQPLVSAAAIALENVRLFSAMQRQSERLEALYQVSQDLALLRDLDALLNQIVERAVRLLNGDGGRIDLYRSEAEILECVVALGNQVIWLGAKLNKGDELSGKVWQTETTMSFNSFSALPGAGNQTETYSGSVIGAPIQWGQEFLGVLLVRHDGAGEPFSEEEMILLAQFAAHAAIAIHNARLYEQVQAELDERKRTQEQVQASLKEKEILLQEVHHRVKNNLQVISSLLDLQADIIDDEAITQLFRDSQHRVKSMSLIHEQLYHAKDLTGIKFADYIQYLVANLSRSYRREGRPIKVETQVEDIFLDLDTAIPCGLIINELVSNALKYAFPEPGTKLRKDRISITLRRLSPEQLLLIVSDNGVGLPMGVELENTVSLGLQLVPLLTRQLEGTLILDRHKGTTFEIRFKYP